MTLNKILTSINTALKVTGLLGLKKPDGTNDQHDQLAGIPLGTSDGSSTGEIGAKVIVISQNADQPGFGIPPYDYQAFTYVGSTNNVATIVYKSGGSGGTLVRTQTFTYVGSGAADNDKIASITAS